MTEPVASVYPTSLDSATTLFGDPENLMQFTLDAGIDASVATISVAEDISNFNVPNYILIGSELIYVEAKSSGDFATCTRGADGTTAAAHLSGAAVYHTFAGNMFAQVKRALIAVETEIGAAPKTITDNTTPAASPTSVASYLDMIATILKRTSGQSNWYSALNPTGWIEVTDTWTYASATTITVPSDATTRYQKGWGIRFKQGAGYKYMYITTVAATLLTVNGGSDFSVANSTITDVAYSPNPNNAFGFPSYFTYAVTWSSDGTQPSLGSGSATGYFRIHDRRAFYEIYIAPGAGMSAGTGNYSWTIPVNTSSITHNANPLVYDAGTAVYTTFWMQISTNVVFGYGSGVARIGAASPMAPVSGDQYIFFGDYIF